MKIFWKYENKNDIIIYERDTETEMERCIYSTRNNKYNRKLLPFDTYNIKEELIEHSNWDSITEISDEEVFLEMI